MSFFGYTNEHSHAPNKGPLGTSPIYRFLAGLGTVCFLSFICGWRPWNNDARDWANLLGGAFVGIGAVKEGMGFIFYIFMGKYLTQLEDMNYWYVAMLLIISGCMIYFNFLRW